MRVCVRSLFLLESPTAGIAPPPALPLWDVSQLAGLGLESKTQCLPATAPHLWDGNKPGSLLQNTQQRTELMV